MKTKDEIAGELWKQRQFLWYVDWLKWNRENPVEKLSLQEVEKIRSPAFSFAVTIDDLYKDEFDTWNLADASETDRASIRGQCVALAWVLGVGLREVEEHCGPKPGVPLPPLPGVTDPLE